MTAVRTIGIVGGSGSGKSTLARALARRIGEDRVRILKQDFYYRDLSHLPLGERARTNFDAPESLDLAGMGADLAALRAGRSVRPPRYDMATHARIGFAEEVEPAPVILAEGTLLLADPAVAETLDAVVYVELPAEQRLARRIRRDVEDRGRTEESVRARWEATVLPMYREHTAPIRNRADLVVSGAAPVEETARAVAAALLT